MLKIYYAKPFVLHFQEVNKPEKANLPYFSIRKSKNKHTRARQPNL
jgi:hypothetical protein